MDFVENDSEGSDLNSQELQERAVECRPENTRKTTEWAQQTYRRWAERRQNVDHVKVNLLDYGGDLKALDRALFKFYGEVHTLDGAMFTPSSLQVLRAGLQRYLSDNVPDMPVMGTHPEFKRYVPLHQADLTRPPPPLPFWARTAATPAKIYSGSFFNCTFN